MLMPYQITVSVVTLILISGCVYGDDHHRNRPSSTGRASAGVYSKAKLKQSITEGKIVFCMLHISMQYNFDKLLIIRCCLLESNWSAIVV
jgi:hypothetical protein